MDLGRLAQFLGASVWHRVPVSRRAAVLVLLFVGRAGEWRVVLTRRLARLRSFPGHILLPGGKADTGLELAFMVARREACEEIGLGREEAFGARVEPVAELPCYLLRTLLAVRPCVAVLHAPDGAADLGLRLNPGESLAIFLCPLADFFPGAGAAEAILRLNQLVKWGGVPWHLRLVTFARENEREAPWLRGLDDADSASEEDEAGEKHQWGPRGARRNSANTPIYDVWGLTANILHDILAVVHGQAPAPFGQEELISALWRHGHMRDERLALEKSLIADLGASFGALLPRAEMVRLRGLYALNI